MDVKQFDLFERTFQFAMDESRRKKSDAFDMESWLIVKPGPARRFERMEIRGETRATIPVTQAAQCGTSACLAGTGVMLHGSGRLIMFQLDSESSKVQVQSVLTEEGELVDVDDYAQELFGITDEEAARLFFALEEDIDELVELGRSVAAGYGYKLNII